MSNSAFFYGVGAPGQTFRGYAGLSDAASDNTVIANGRAVLETASHRMDLWTPGTTAGSWYWNLRNTLEAYDRGTMPLATAAKNVQAFADAVKSVTPQSAVSRRPDLAAQIEGFYQGYFKRHSDPGGLEFYTQQLIDGVPQSQIQNAFLSSSEYVAPAQPGPAPVSGLLSPVSTAPAGGVGGLLSAKITLPIVGPVPLVLVAAVAGFFLLSKS